MAQCFYYRGFTLRDPKVEPRPSIDVADERAPLLANGNSGTSPTERGPRASSAASIGERFQSLGEHFSPATPMHPPPSETQQSTSSRRLPILKAVLFNATAILVVVAAGVAGYYLSPSQTEQNEHRHDAKEEQDSSLVFSPWGQVFGYLCAVLYLGSRIPQLLLNYRRKSTEGLNALFFLFACIGNLTYVLSIFAFEPICHGGKRGKHCAPGESSSIYGRYILVNLSWLVGSLGTLFLDMGVFAQFFMYRHNDEDRGRSLEGNDR